MAQEGHIKGFNQVAFAKNLAGQAEQLLPPDLSAEDKKFVVDILYKFCVMSGEALNNDETIQIDVNQASLISQFIGEWSFHKAIDLIHAGIETSLREPILQKVAFTVFEIAKQAVIKRMPQEQIIPLVEHHVNKSFSAALDELETTGAVDKELKEKALKQSNIDAMAKQQVQEETPSSGMSDSKIIKLASLAYLIKGFEPEKIKVILSKFNKKESAVLMQYLGMKDLESKLNPEVAAKFLKEVKQILPVPDVLSYEKCFVKLCKIVNNSEKNKISSIIKDERPLIKQFVNSAYSGQATGVPAMVASVICKYLEEKVS